MGNCSCACLPICTKKGEEETISEDHSDGQEVKSEDPTDIHNSSTVAPIDEVDHDRKGKKVAGSSNQAETENVKDVASDITPVDAILGVDQMESGSKEENTAPDLTPVGALTEPKDEASESAKKRQLCSLSDTASPSVPEKEKWRKEKANKEDSEEILALDDGEEEEEEMISLLCADKSLIVQVPLKAKDLVGLMSATYEGDKTMKELHLTHTTLFALECTKRYIDHHLEHKPKAVRKPITAKVFSKVVHDAFDVELLSGLSFPEYQQLCNSADHMQIDGLLDCLHGLLAVRCQGHTTEEIIAALAANEWPVHEAARAELAEEDSEEEEILGLDAELERDEANGPLSDLIFLEPGSLDSSLFTNGVDAFSCAVRRVEEEKIEHKLSHMFLLKTVQYISPDPTLMVSRKNAMLSVYIRNLIEVEPDSYSFKCKQCDIVSLRGVVEYLNHHRGKEPAEIAKPIRSMKMESIVEDLWDADYITKFSKKQLFKVILAANYLDIKSLLHLGCARVATMIKGKSPEQIKDILGTEDNSDDTDAAGAENTNPINESEAEITYPTNEHETEAENTNPFKETETEVDDLEDKHVEFSPELETIDENEETGIAEVTIGTEAPNLDAVPEPEKRDPGKGPRELAPRIDCAEAENSDGRDDQAEAGDMDPRIGESGQAKKTSNVNDPDPAKDDTEDADLVDINEVEARHLDVGKEGNLESREDGHKPGSENLKEDPTTA